MHKQREGRGQKPLIPKILGTAAVRREGENAARKGKNAEETCVHTAMSTLGECRRLVLEVYVDFKKSTRLYTCKVTY